VERVEYSKRMGWIRKALRTLTLRERRIVRARHLAKTPRTLEELGTELGVSQERVRQIEHQAISKLRRKVLTFQNLSAAPA
jgi:RNA polymerase sigma-32 factor